MADQFAESLRDLRGHPRLTRREEELVAQIQRLHEDGFFMGTYQRAVVRRLKAKITAPEAEETEREFSDSD